MGRRIRIEGDDDALVEAATSALGAERVAGDSPAATRIHLVRGRGGLEAGDVALAVDGRRLRLSGAGAEGEANADERSAWCSVPPAFIADPQALRSELLDPILLFLLTRDGLVPVHAAAFLLGPTAVLLTGPSGIGKSTLALAALRAGLSVLAEDTVYVELEPTFRLWGLVTAIHVFPTDAPPAQDGPLRLRGGRRKRAVPIPSAARATNADRAILCVLVRGADVGLERISSEAARQALSSLEPGFDLLREETRGAVAALASGGAWRLTLSDRPADAVALLREAFDGEDPWIGGPEACAWSR
jgi:hypothetical protein